MSSDITWHMDLHTLFELLVFLWMYTQCSVYFKPDCPVLLKAIRSRLELPGAVRTLSIGLRRPEPYNDRRIKRENAREQAAVRRR